MKENQLSQNDAIKERLLLGESITAIDALNLFGCFRLSARIHNLRMDGMDIETDLVEVNGKRFASYRMKNETK